MAKKNAKASSNIPNNPPEVKELPKIPFVIAGIDYSMNCPSICVHKAEDSNKEVFSIDNCTFYFLTPVQKYANSYLNMKINGCLQPPYECDVERFSNSRDFFCAIIEEHEVDWIGLEDYAYGAKGRLAHIGENTGILKAGIFDSSGKVPNVFSPNEVKKFATGSGSADKDRMYEFFYKETGWDLVSIVTGYDKKKIDSPIGDLVDSYYICKYLFYLGINPADSPDPEITVSQEEVEFVKVQLQNVKEVLTKAGIYDKSGNLVMSSRSTTISRREK